MQYKQIMHFKIHVKTKLKLDRCDDKNTYISHKIKNSNNPTWIQQYTNV